MAECATDIHHIETNNNATATTNLFGSFHYIVHEQAKSMVAIQELQQEVGSLLLFRQAVLAALPHLQSKAFMSSSSSSAAVAAIINNPSAIKLNNAANTWTRRRHLQQQQHQQQQQYRSLHDSSASSSEHTVATTPPTATTTPTSAAAATATATQLQHHNGVADSGFSTEANSNTSPRSSRFETGVSSSSSTGNPLDLGKLEAGILHLNNAAACKKSANHMEKELSQHLERVRSRIARLRKDEDRLMNLLSSPQTHELSHGVRASQKTDADAAARRVAVDAADAVDAVDVDVVDADDQVEPCDELWQLLEEIQSKGLEMKEEIETIKLVAVADAASSAGREALRGLLLSPAAEGLPGPANVRIYDEKDYLLRCLAALERDMHYLRARQLDAEEDWHKTQQRCLVASKEVEYTRKRVKETEQEMHVIRDKLDALTDDHRPTPDDVHLMTGLNGGKSAGDAVNSHLSKDGRGYAEPNVIGGHHHYNNNNHNKSSNGKCVPMAAPATANSHVTRVHVNEAGNAMTSVGSPSTHHNSCSGGSNPKKRVSFQEGVVTVSMPAPLVSGHGAGATSAATTIKYVRPSREKVAAILRLSNPVQLQRHLLRALLENEALREQLERTKTEVTSRESQWRANSQEVSEQMAVVKEENEDLRFQLEEQKIELEGTKARLRLVNRTPPPALVSVQMKTAATQTEPSHHAMLASSFHSSGIHEGTQTDSSPSSSPDNYKAARILPRVIDVSPKSKLSKLNALMDQERKGSNSWDDEDRPSVERRSFSSGGNAPVSRIPTPIKHSNLVTAASPALCVKTAHSAAAAAAPGKRELPDIPVSQSNNVSIVTNSHSLRSKRKDKDNLVKVSSTSSSPGKHSSTAAATSTRSPGASTTPSTKSATQSRDLNEAKVRIGRTTVNSGSPNHLGHQHSNNQQQNQGRTRLKLTESLSSSEDNNMIHDSLSSNEGAQISFKGDDYYDSINENRRASALIKSGISSGSGSSTYASPIDSLERSLPSVGINYHYRRSRDISSSHDNRSSYSSGSTTPSNSLSFHG